MKLNGRMMMVAMIALALCTFVASSASAADAKAGADVYSAKCKMCHGADGAGNPGMAKALKVEFKHLGGPEVQKMSDADLKKVVTTGKDKMKPVAGVAGADLDNVIAYVRTLKK